MSHLASARRALIVGSGRSGTTLLQALVGVHPDVITFPETHYCEIVVGEQERLVFGRSLATAERPVHYLLARARAALGLASLRTRKGWLATVRLVGLTPETAPSLPYGGLLSRPAVDAFIELMDQAAEEEGGRIWLEKSPNHLFYLPELARAAPDLRILHTVRSGTEVVASMVQAARRYPGRVWDRVADPEEAAQWWNRALEATLAVAHHPNHHVVRYERLAAHPAEVLAGVFAFLGLPDHPEAVEAYRREARRIVTDAEPWKVGTSADIANRGAGRFERMFDVTERRRITDALLFGGDPPAWAGDVP